MLVSTILAFSSRYPFKVDITIKTYKSREERWGTLEQATHNLGLPCISFYAEERATVALYAVWYLPRPQLEYIGGIRAMDEEIHSIRDLRLVVSPRKGTLRQDYCVNYCIYGVYSGSRR